MTPVRDRARGALIGLATGDAVGTTVEFKPRGSFPPVTTMTGGGPFGLEPGQFTDTLGRLSSFDTVAALRRIEAPVWLVNGQFDLFRMQERAFLAAARSGTLVRQPGARLARGIRDPRVTAELLVDIVDGHSRRPVA